MDHESPLGPPIADPIPRPPRRLVRYGALVVLTLIWGTTWAAIRIGLSGVPPFTGAVIRFVVASVVLMALALLMRASFAVNPRVVRLWWANGVLLFVCSYGVGYLAVVGTVVMFVMYFWLLEHMPVTRIAWPGPERLAVETAGARMTTQGESS